MESPRSKLSKSRSDLLLVSDVLLGAKAEVEEANARVEEAIKEEEAVLRKKKAEVSADMDVSVYFFLAGVK